MIVFIFDIDSTLADNEHRAAFLEKHCGKCGKVPTDPHKHRPKCICGSNEFKISQESWDNFLKPEEVIKDTPIPKAQEFVNGLEDNLFFYLTGRNESLREVTEKWLREHFTLHSEKQLFMRPFGRDIPASAYKKEALEDIREFIESLGRYKNPMFVMFEDDPFVIKEFTEQGLAHMVRAPECWEHINPMIEVGREPLWKR